MTKKVQFYIPEAVSREITTKDVEDIPPYIPEEVAFQYEKNDDYGLDILEGQLKIILLYNQERLTDIKIRILNTGMMWVTLKFERKKRGEG
jgi:hypothetical protein